MNAISIISIILNVIFIIGGCLLFSISKSIAEQNIDLEAKLSKRQEELVLANRKAIRAEIAASNIESRYTFNKKTIKLLTMAVQGTNENEARNAAVEACKLINKSILNR